MATAGREAEGRDERGRAVVLDRLPYGGLVGAEPFSDLFERETAGPERQYLRHSVSSNFYPRCALHICLMRDRFKMIRVNAAAIAAQMIDLEPIGDRTISPFVIHPIG